MRSRSKWSDLIVLTVILASVLWKRGDGSEEFDCVFKNCRCDSALAAATNTKAASANDYDEPDEPSPELDIYCILDESSNGDFPQRSRVPQHRNISDIQVTSQNIIEIPGGRFEGLSISYANLQSNRIQFLRSNLFTSIVKLEILDLKNNNIKYIEKQALEPVATTLIELCLEGNRLSEMSRPSALSESLSHLKMLIRLNLARNNLSQLSDLKALEKLKELNLAHNQIQTIRGEFIPSSTVDLNLAGNRIQSLSQGSFYGLSSLKYLNLDDNQITIIESTAFQFSSHLVVLNLARNNLKTIPSKALINLGFLERFDLSSQKSSLRVIHDYAFDRSDNEQTSIRVDLSKNKIGKIGDKAFCSRNSSIQFAYISDLDLGGNHLGHLNACILRQLWKGLTMRNNTRHRPKLSLKEINTVSSLQRSVKCDCETTKSIVYVQMEGKCERAAKSYEELEKFHCDALEGHDVQLEVVESECANSKQFDCTLIDYNVAPAGVLPEQPYEFIPKNIQHSEETAHEFSLNKISPGERTSLLVEKPTLNISQQDKYSITTSPNPKHFNNEAKLMESKQNVQRNGFARLQPSMLIFFAFYFFQLIFFLNI